MSFGDFKMGGWPLLAGWIFPSLIFVSLLSALALPRFPDQLWIAWILNLKFSERMVVLIAVAAALGLVLSACSKTLYRILEGYRLMPSRLGKTLTEKQHIKREKLLKDYGEAQNSPGQAIDVGLLLEKCISYPVPSLDVAPTTFGNVLRAAETYGWDRYELDTVTYYSGLLAHCPEHLRTTEERAKTSVDFFVVSCYLSVLAFATAMVMLFTGVFMPTLVYLAASAIVCMGSYFLAISAARSWGEEIKTVVDVGRVGLLKSVGLEKPDSLSDERAQWRAMGWLRKYSSQKSEKGLRGSSLWPNPVGGKVDELGNCKASDSQKMKEQLPPNNKSRLGLRVRRWLRS